MTSKKTSWIPEIFYEEDANGISSSIPFICVPKDEVMPQMIFLFESRETGEFEPDLEGNESPITEITLHQYVDMQILKEGLQSDEYDRVRQILGLLPLEQAMSKGKAITESIAASIKE